MWHTPEGALWTLSEVSLNRLLRQLPQSGLLPLLRHPDQGSLPKTLRRLTAHLARRARYVGSTRHVASGRYYPVFHAAVGTQTYSILTRRLPSGSFAVLAIGASVPLDDAEAMVNIAPQLKHCQKLTAQKCRACCEGRQAEAEYLAQKPRKIPKWERIRRYFTVPAEGRGIPRPLKRSLDCQARCLGAVGALDIAHSKRSPHVMTQPGDRVGVFPQERSVNRGEGRKIAQQAARRRAKNPNAVRPKNSH